jgi:hypothetical protein
MRDISPSWISIRSLNARIKVLQGVMVPYESDWPIFGDFIQDCLKRRASYPKGTLLNMFWKEISNSSYGKTAQGLRERRVFDVQSKESEALPPSRITNPFYAAFITSFVRGVLSEIINGLPDDVCVFSCTTDGFLSNAKPADIQRATEGRLCALYRQSRAKLTGQDGLLEIKHKVRQPIGWRTRGQATLKPGNHGDPSIPNVVLAKGGIRLPEYIEDTASQNDEIVRMFLNRTPGDKIVLTPQISVRDMVLFDSDLVEREVTKRLSMEFDWKRRPVAAVQATSPNHIAFSTAPWDSVEEFRFVRESLEKYLQKNATCFKTLAEYRQFTTYMVGRGSLGEEQVSHLAKKDGDIKRLRQSLGSAWKNGEAGFADQLQDLSNAEFAELLSSVGIPCKRTDVENDRKLYFTPHRCPATPAVRAALKKLVAHVPTIETAAFLTTETPPVDLTRTINARCQFTAKIVQK